MARPRPSRGLLAAVLLLAVAGRSECADGIEWTPAREPTMAQKEEAARWWADYRRELAGVRRDWSAVAQAIRSGRFDTLPELCQRFRRSIETVDRDRLLHIDDAVIRIHLHRGLQSLNRSHDRCRRERLFDLVYQLEQARAALITVERRFDRYRLQVAKPHRE